MPIRVLVADDEPAPRRLLEGVLAKAGYTVSAADGGQEAVALGRAHAFDIALLDVMMPDLDGVAVLQQLKALQPELIVIMVSALVSIDTAVEAMQEETRLTYQVTLTIQRALRPTTCLRQNSTLSAVSADLQTAPRTPLAPLRGWERIFGLSSFGHSGGKVGYGKNAGVRQGPGKPRPHVLLGAHFWRYQGRYRVKGSPPVWRTWSRNHNVRAAARTKRKVFAPTIRSLLRH